MARKKSPHFHEQAVYAGDYSPAFKGLGHCLLNRQRGLRGAKLGPANEGRQLTKEEREEIERKLKSDGIL